MAYSNKSIIHDVNQKPVPQYFNIEKDKFEVVEGKDGKLKTIICDSQGNEVRLQALVNQIKSKIDELIGVINNGL